MYMAVCIYTISEIKFMINCTVESFLVMFFININAINLPENFIYYILFN